jgi:hypothetical protein
MLKKTPKDVRREQNQNLVRELLSSKYLTLSVGPLAISEHIATGETEVKCELFVSSAGSVLDTYDVFGRGMGFVDALFNGIADKIVEDCQTFKNLTIQEFYVDVDRREIEDHSLKGLRGSAANVDICLVLHNGYSTESSAHVPFRSRSRSMISAGAQVIIQAVEFYVNSERAVLELRNLIKDAEARSRTDLVEKYVCFLSELTANTSYENI